VNPPRAISDKVVLRAVEVTLASLLLSCCDALRAGGWTRPPARWAHLTFLDKLSPASRLRHPRLDVGDERLESLRDSWC